jgi:hypothetical protein
MHWPGRCVVRKLSDSTGNPAPYSLAFVITDTRELVGARGVSKLSSVARAVLASQKLSGARADIRTERCARRGG